MVLMRIALLGPVRVYAADAPVAVRGLRARRAIALLALNAGRPVAVDHLVDTLWPEDPPATCREQVYNCVAGLRRALGATVIRGDGGYTLMVAADRVDALAFEASVRSAAAPDRAAAVAALRAGLRLWHGDALEGVAGGPLGRVATRLDTLRGDAWERLFDLELAARRDTDLLAELAAVAERYPLRERLTCQLATALWECGWAARALEVCQEHRRQVRAEFAVEPGAAVRELEARIRSGQTAPARPAASPAAGTAASRSPGRRPRPAPHAGAAPVERARVDRLLAEVRVLLAEVRGLVADAGGFSCPTCPPGT
ncbi:BTAD domain-containing putative transcriptional regulator [Asanoa sp. WMMD1127]|uniref:AfsR/SARP family transcriptional regulator n=1 Tax=Asanoa sp. WMMD1127 TaxID=3016107 RepID=UPI002416C1E9|nr:BTAD domain-containing putative transcriptional regulator [Asanoa sp. WMMD1127]MDG4825695.1 BTAD domain-containing putative transcriptional regulator [Asanoa sp. WMMD1127]